jgi:hypothetical protein
MYFNSFSFPYLYKVIPREGGHRENFVWHNVYLRMSFHLFGLAQRNCIARHPITDQCVCVCVCECLKAAPQERPGVEK